MTDDELKKALWRIFSEFLGGPPSTDAPANSSKRKGLELASYSPQQSSVAARDLPPYLVGKPEPERPNPSEVSLLANARTKLSSEKKKLLLTVQKDNSVHVFDPESKTFELYCRLLNTPMFLWRALPAPNGKVFIAMSGSRWPGYPTEIAFGQGGAIFEVDNAKEQMTLLPGGDRFIDPGEILFEDGKLIVLDFQGFGGTGAVYELDLSTGDRTILGEGDPLREPAALARLSKGQYVIANAFMGYHASVGPGGRPIKDSGALVTLDRTSGRFDVLVDESGTPQGAIDSVTVSDVNPEYVLYTRNDWPSQETGGVFVLDKNSGDRRAVIEASEKEPIFARVGDATAGIATIADSYNKVLHKVNIKDAKILDTWSLEPVLGPGKGMVSPVEAVEAVYWI